MGAMPGKLIQCLKKTKTENPLVLIDEVRLNQQNFLFDQQLPSFLFHHLFSSVLNSERLLARMPVPDYKKKEKKKKNVWNFFVFVSWCVCLSACFPAGLSLSVSVCIPACFTVCLPVSSGLSISFCMFLLSLCMSPPSSQKSSWSALAAYRCNCGHSSWSPGRKKDGSLCWLGHSKRKKTTCVMYT